MIAEQAVTEVIDYFQGIESPRFNRPQASKETSKGAYFLAQQCAVTLHLIS